MSSAYGRLLDALRDRGSTVTENGHGKSQAQCPAHDDGRASLSVTRIDGSTLVYCHAGCQTGNVLAALGLQMCDLYDDRKGATYTYPDGRKVHRTANKKFRQSGNTKGSSLFRADRIGDAGSVFVVEGEKDTLAIETVGGVAVCPAMGAGKADRFDWSPLRGKGVVIVADKDGPGRKHAVQVAELVAPIAKSVRTVEAAVGKDVADHIAAGKTLEELIEPQLRPPVNGAELLDGLVVDGEALLDELEEWFTRFIAVTDERDLALLALWTVHTHLAIELYTTPRIQLDSTMPGSGKTTVLDHLSRLCVRPVQVASLSSPALLPRLLEKGMRTILLDEVQRTLRPDKPGVGELLAILNSGYRRGASRPVLVPTKGGGWEDKEMSTHAPVAMAGNSPHLEDDTRSRAVRILLMPDFDGSMEDSDWEFIEDEAAELHDRIARFADHVRDQVAGHVELPEGCVGRQKEKWRPLKRVAVVAGGRWPAVADGLVVRGLAEDEADRDAGLRNLPPGAVLLKDLYKTWPDTDDLVPTCDLVLRLIAHNPDYWGEQSSYGKALTETRFGKLLKQASNVASQRPGGRGHRGYFRSDLAPVWTRLRISKPTETPPKQPGAPGEPGAPGADNRVHRVNQVHQVESEALFDPAQDPDGGSGGRRSRQTPDGALFAELGAYGEDRRCACGNGLASPEARTTSKCKPCRDKATASTDLSPASMPPRLPTAPTTN